MVITNTEEKVYQPLRENIVGGEGLRKESEGQVRQSILCIFQGKVAQNLEKVSIGSGEGGRRGGKGGRSLL